MIKSKKHKPKQLFPRSSILLMFLSLHLHLSMTVGHICGHMTLQRGRERLVALTLVYFPTPHPSWWTQEVSLLIFLSYTYESVQKVFLSFFSGTFRRGHCREHLLFSSARFPSYPHLGRATPLLWWANPPWLHQVLVGLLLIVSHLPAYRGGYIIRNWPHIYSICCWPH